MLYCATYVTRREINMHIRLDGLIEQKLAFFANELHTTKTDLVKPYIFRLLEDMEDYFYASKALKEEGSISLEALEEEFRHVAD